MSLIGGARSFTCTGSRPTWAMEVTSLRSGTQTGSQIAFGNPNPPEPVGAFSSHDESDGREMAVSGSRTHKGTMTILCEVHPLVQSHQVSLDFPKRPGVCSVIKVLVDLSPSGFSTPLGTIDKERPAWQARASPLGNSTHRGKQYTPT